MSCPITNSVQDLLGNNYDPSIDLTPFVEAATILLARIVACAEAKGKPLTEDEKAVLVKYLAAHFYGSSDQYYESRRTGRASGTFRGKTEMGLDATLYGQNAKLLDPSGCLVAMDKKVQIQFGWLGKRPSEQIPYWNRR